MDFQTIAALIFIALMVLFIYLKRKNVHIQKIAYPFLYFAMYRTKVGIKAMDRIAASFPKAVRYAGYAAVAVGFFGMAFMAFMLVYNLISLFIVPEAAQGVALVLPFKIKGSFYVPFLYWIISIFVIAVVHEFSHGVVARSYGLKIKSSGLAFLGVIVPVLPAAFVEPDEKELEKRSFTEKMSIFAAGPFSNIALAAVVLVLFLLVFSPLASALLEPDGVRVTGFLRGNSTSPAEQAGIARGDMITSLNGANISNVQSLSDALNSTSPGQQVLVGTGNSTYSLTLGANPDDPAKSYLGVYIQQSTRVSPGFEEKYGAWLAALIIWVIGLFYWLYALNLGIGLFNLVPLGPIDGGRMLLALLKKKFPEEKAVRIWKSVSSFFLMIIIINILFAFAA